MARWPDRRRGGARGVAAIASPTTRAAVRELLNTAPVLLEVDPRELSATQPLVTRAGVEHYMGEVYPRTGRTYARLSPHRQPGTR